MVLGVPILKHFRVRLGLVPVILLQAVPRQLLCFGSLVVLDVMCGYVFLFLLDV